MWEEIRKETFKKWGTGITTPLQQEKILQFRLQEQVYDKNWFNESKPKSGPSEQFILEKYGQMNMFSPSNMIMCSTCMNNDKVLG